MTWPINSWIIDCTLRNQIQEFQIEFFHLKLVTLCVEGVRRVGGFPILGLVLLDFDVDAIYYDILFGIGPCTSSLAPKIEDGYWCRSFEECL